MTNPTTAAERELGVSTLNVIVDQLKGYEILATPANMNHRIAWCVVLGATHSDGTDPSHLIYLLRTSMLQAKNPIPEKSFALLVLRPDEPFESAFASLSKNLIARTIVVREPPEGKPLNILQSELLSFFFRSYCWKVRCDEVLRSGGSLQDLLDETEKYTGNWINVTDGSYSLLARTRHQDPPGPLCKELVERGCHSTTLLSNARDLGIFREWRDQTDIQTFEPTDLTPYESITAVLRIKGDYHGHVVMVCTKASVSKGMMDFFALVAGYCQDIIERDGRQNASSTSLHRDFLESLLLGKTFSKDYIDTQSILLGIEQCSFFRLLIVEYANSDMSNQPLFLMNTLTNLFPRSFTLLYNGDIVLLFCENEYDPNFDLRRRELTSEFCTKYGCVAYSSGHAHLIKDVALLYAQARITAQYRSCIDCEKAPLFPNQHPHSYIFEEAFNYYCCDFGRKDDLLLAFCLNNTMLDLVINREQDRDVPDAKLLYCYLCNERKATPTAELLHMHRNNVLYRIGNIEKRYHFDLGQYGLRQYLLLCYRIKIQSSASFRKLLLG